jgi:hypothetical protein
MNNISILQWGDLPDTSLLDEVGFAVKSLTIKAARTKKLYKNGKGATFAARFIDPIITFSFTGMRAPFDDTIGPPTPENIGWKHPGVEVAPILNFADTYRGFDPDLGVLIHEEPEDSLNGEDPTETKFDVVQYPFIAADTYEEIS